MTKYKYIIIEFDRPIMDNDKLTFTNITLEEAKEKFKNWCDRHQVTVESRNPRCIKYAECAKTKGETNV